MKKTHAKCASVFLFCSIMYCGLMAIPVRGADRATLSVDVQKTLVPTSDYVDRSLVRPDGSLLIIDSDSTDAPDNAAFFWLYSKGKFERKFSGPEHSNDASASALTDGGSLLATYLLPENPLQTDVRVYAPDSSVLWEKTYPGVPYGSEYSTRLGNGELFLMLVGGGMRGHGLLLDSKGALVAELDDLGFDPAQDGYWGWPVGLSDGSLVYSVQKSTQRDLTLSRVTPDGVRKDLNVPIFEEGRWIGDLGDGKIAIGGTPIQDDRQAVCVDLTSGKVTTLFGYAADFESGGPGRMAITTVAIPLPAPGGGLLFLAHGTDPDGKTSIFVDLLTPSCEVKRAATILSGIDPSAPESYLGYASLNAGREGLYFFTYGTEIYVLDSTFNLAGSKNVGDLSGFNQTAVRWAETDPGVFLGVTGSASHAQYVTRLHITLQ